MLPLFRTAFKESFYSKKPFILLSRNRAGPTISWQPEGQTGLKCWLSVMLSLLYTASGWQHSWSIGLQQVFPQIRILLRWLLVWSRVNKFLVNGRGHPLAILHLDRASCIPMPTSSDSRFISFALCGKIKMNLIAKLWTKAFAFPICFLKILFERGMIVSFQVVAQFEI